MRYLLESDENEPLHSEDVIHPGEKEESFPEKEEFPGKIGKRRMFDREEMLAVLLPTCIEIPYTIFMFTGLLFLGASPWQMLKGAQIIAAAFAAVLLLGHKMQNHEVLGIAIALMGSFAIGAAAILNPPASKGLDNAPSHDDAIAKAALGVFLTCIAMILGGLQIVVEEKILRDLHIPPTLIVFYEGLFGWMLCGLVFHPLAAYVPGFDVGGVLEDEWDTAERVRNFDGEAAGILMIFCFSVAPAHYLRLELLKVFSAVQYAMLAGSIAAPVYFMDVIGHQVNPESPYFGKEKWHPIWTPVLVIGFTSLLIGHATFGGYFREENTIDDIILPAPPKSSIVGQLNQEDQHDSEEEDKFLPPTDEALSRQQTSLSRLLSGQPDEKLSRQQTPLMITRLVT